MPKTVSGPPTMEEKIQLKHPAGKNAVKMAISKYAPIKAAIIRHLEKVGSASFTEICKAIEDDFKRNKIKFEGSLPWYTVSVKLDLEANNIIKRLPKTSPEKLALVK